MKIPVLPGEDPGTGAGLRAPAKTPSDDGEDATQQQEEARRFTRTKEPAHSGERASGMGEQSGDGASSPQLRRQELLKPE